jgi:hypothetical protein
MGETVPEALDRLAREGREAGERPGSLTEARAASSVSAPGPCACALSSQPDRARSICALAGTRSSEPASIDEVPD